MQVIGERAMLASGTVERYYRDTPLMIIGEGTNEIQRTIIARNLVDRFGERATALVSHDAEAPERRQMVLAVRQLVEKDVAPLAHDHEQAGRSAAVVLPRLADLGVLAAPLSVDDGGLGLPAGACALLLEEIARGWGSLAALTASHLVAVRALGRHGAALGVRAMLGALGRGETRAATSLGGEVHVRRVGRDVVLDGESALVDGAAGADLLVIAAGDGEDVTLLAVPTATAGVRIAAPDGVLGLRSAEPAHVTFAGVRLPAAGSVFPAAAVDDTYGFAHLAVAAIGVGIAQAAFEAALRYAQQRSAFGKPISQHQAIQLKLADMATAIAAARMLVTDAGDDPVRAAIAKLQASSTAVRVTLESMRTHGGYGYTTEFPVERYYRDAARLLHSPMPEGEARAATATRLRARDLD